MSEGNACKDLEWMVGPLVDGELPQPEVERLERHLRGCPACSRLAEDFRSFDRLARHWPKPPPVSTSEWAELWEGIASRRPAVWLTVRRKALDWALPALSLAALALLSALIVVAVVDKLGQDHPKNAMEMIQGTEDEGTPVPTVPEAKKPAKSS